MTITKRITKGSALTYAELDENFRDLDEDMTIDRVLGNGNTTTKDMTIGSLTVSQPVIAHIVMTSDQLNLTEQQWNKMNFDTAVIDTKSGFDSSNNRYTIPVAGYYRIYIHAFMGVEGQGNSTRDSGVCITRTRSSTETQIAFSAHRHFDATSDTSDVTETAYIIDNCQVGDHIQFYSYVNTDTSDPYDIFADVDAADDNSHLNTGLPGTGSGEGRSTYFTIERIPA